MQKFSATIGIVYGNPFVPVPEKVLRAVFAQAKKDKGPVPVRGTFNGAPYIQTLVRFRGAWRLYANGPMLKAGKVGVGDRTKVTISHDPKPRTWPMPPKFRRQLAAHKKAKAAFEALAPYRKKEILRYFSFMKTQESLDRNIAIVMAHLMGKKVKGLHALLRITPSR